jgi:hypothetical protein
MGWRYTTIIIGIVVSLWGCSGDSSNKEEFILRVNDYRISKDEVNAMLKYETQLNSNFYLSDDTRVNFIKDLIQTQLLIQEAKRRELDQRESFRRTIQRYWESTLIRDLLQEKGEQIRKTVVISEEEVDMYFETNKDNFSAGSEEKVKNEIVRILEQKKVTARLEKWIEELKAGAVIEIQDPELAEKVKHKSN